MAMTQNGRLATDDNDKPVMGGTSSADNATIINSSYDPVTRRLLTDASGATGTFVTNEVVAGSGTSYTLAHTPILGSQAIYGMGQRLTPTNDYTISSATITTVNTWNAGEITADYRY